MNVHYFGNFTNAGLFPWALVYRLNGKGRRTYNWGMSSSAALYLVDGDNVLEIATSNVPVGGYPRRSPTSTSF
jgi:hypothetical protein